jgi:urea transport system ATP-binding protein
VTSGYDEGPINRGVTFEIDEGQILAIVGRNGVGKTTLARTIVGLVRPSSGKVLLRGTDITRTDARERALAGIGYVPQGRGIFGQLTVQENLTLGTAIGRRAAGAQSLVDVYKLFPILEERRMQKRGR